MMPENLTPEERQTLLLIARKAIQHAVNQSPDEPIEWENLPERLCELGTVFVTLTENGSLRGCVGSLEPYQSLAEDVWDHAIAAAVSDYRFPPVQPWEIDQLKIEISRLTIPQPLEYAHPGELLTKLRPGIDGVVIRDGHKRATFLPQVWEKLPKPDQFLNHLCAKMNAPEDLWRRKPLQVLIYQVEEFQEQDLPGSPN